SLWFWYTLSGFLKLPAGESDQNGTTTITDETEVIFLRNRVKCLEDEVRKLNDTINRLVSSNTDYRR
ncbi:unnamed protein product, partial [Arabidopsis halleri]